jgi:hypothetical protein
MTNPNQATPIHEESTYQMLVDAEEKKRGLIEGIVYLLLLAATAATIWQFSHQPVTFAEIGALHAEKVATFLS